MKKYFDRVLEQLRQFLCGFLHGHDALLHFETGRLSMRCTSCCYETPGWDLRPTERPNGAMNLRVIRGNRERRIA